MSVLKKRKIDLLIVGLLLIISGCIWIFIIKYNHADGNEVEVYVDDKLVNTFSLTKNQEYKIDSEYGFNILKIDNGKVWICKASCKNHICMEHNKISHNGESIICLPNHLVIRIINGERSPKIDAIVK